MLKLEEILKIVHEKYPNAFIGQVDGYSYIFLKETKKFYFKDIILINKNKVFINVNQDNLEEYYMYEKYSFDNIIELKHYLDIEIIKEDIIEQFKGNKDVYYNEKYEEFNVFDIFFNLRYNLIFVDSNSTSNIRSLWQIYNILKNLVE